MTAKQTVKAICEALLEKKGVDIQVLQVERLTELTEYFVICSATSTTQVKSLADNVEWRLKYDHETLVHHTEGYESAQWMLLDYGCVVLHVFMPEARKFIIWRICGRTASWCRWPNWASKKKTDAAGERCPLRCRA